MWCGVILDVRLMGLHGAHTCWYNPNREAMYGECWSASYTDQCRMSDNRSS